MRWIALLALALTVSAALLILLVVPPTSALPASAMHAGLDEGCLRSDGVQPARSTGSKSRWRRRCY
jgi:hypothetical protein